MKAAVEPNLTLAVAFQQIERTIGGVGSLAAKPGLVPLHLLLHAVGKLFDLVGLLDDIE